MKKKSRARDGDTLEYVLALIASGRAVAALENRPLRYTFGTLNYGDIPHTLNAADGDPWDVFVPGYEARLPTKREYAIASAIGILQLANGNHKIAVRLKHAPQRYRFDAHRAQIEMRRYAERYTTHVGVNGKLVFF